MKRVMMIDCHSFVDRSFCLFSVVLSIGDTGNMTPPALQRYSTGYSEPREIILRN
jgi:hypothetical protein